jgi:DNA primase
MLKGHVKLIYLLFDGDSAGRQAAIKALPKLLNAEIDGKVLVLPDGEDPDSYLRKNGEGSLYKLAEKESIGLLDYAVDRLMSGRPDTIVGQTQALKEARELLGEVKDSAKGQILQRMLATRLGIDTKHLEFSKGPISLPKSPNKVVSSQPITNYEKLLFHVLAHPETGSILEDLGPFWPEDDAYELFLAMVSQQKNVGQVEASKLPYELSEKLPFISRAAVEGREFEPQVAMQVALSFSSDIKAKRFTEALKKLSREILKAEVEGDSARFASLLEQRRAVNEELRDLEELKISLLQQL